MEIKMDRSHPSGATNDERKRNSLRNSGSASYTNHTMKQGDSPLRTYTNISEFAHMPTPRGALTPPPSLLNEGLSRPAYNGPRRRS
jgi:hypothetical protein